MRWAGVCAVIVASGVLIGANQTARQNVGAVPTASQSCVTDAPAGDRAWTCDGLRVDARVPPACVAKSCGLILELHGDTGTGLLEDAHTRLRDLGGRDGYIVVAPTGPKYTWVSSNDAALVDIVRLFMRSYHVDTNRVHVTGPTADPRHCRPRRDASLPQEPSEE